MIKSWRQLKTTRNSISFIFKLQLYTMIINCSNILVKNNKQKKMSKKENVLRKIKVSVQIKIVSFIKRKIQHDILFRSLLHRKFSRTVRVCAWWQFHNGVFSLILLVSFSGRFFSKDGSWDYRMRGLRLKNLWCIIKFNWWFLLNDETERGKHLLKSGRNIWIFLEKLFKKEFLLNFTIWRGIF